MKIGVLGGGQLGRMLALAGLPLGLRFRFLDPSVDACAGDVGELIVGEFDDQTALDCFCDGVDLATYEFESVPVAAVNTVARHVPVYPPPQALEVAQDRLNEKNLFVSLGVPTPAFANVESKSELIRAIDAFGLPTVLKTRRHGYDGKGQFVVRKTEDIEPAHANPGFGPFILERLVPFERELSILAVRTKAGEMRFYPLVQNLHEQGILRQSIAPAPGLTAELQTEAEGYAQRIMEAVNYVGVLAVEFFQHDGKLLANEMAPRVHNSGHWTIEGAATSQFENHLRAILDWPLGSTAVQGPVMMFNLIGKTPPLGKVLALPGAHVHLYGKTPAPGRKLGHVTLCGLGDDHNEAVRLASILDMAK
jgi:5-(carboxyamino)imidazole ribonucleotide synthase